MPTLISVDALAARALACGASLPALAAWLGGPPSPSKDGFTVHLDWPPFTAARVAPGVAGAFDVTFDLSPGTVPFDQVAERPAEWRLDLDRPPRPVAAMRVLRAPGRSVTMVLALQDDDGPAAHRRVVERVVLQVFNG